MQVLRGGLADKKKAKDFSPKALAQGRKVESEHTSNPRIATEIAEDHLTEDPMYYDKLKLIEKKAFADELMKIAKKLPFGAGVYKDLAQHFAVKPKLKLPGSAITGTPAAAVRNPGVIARIGG
jgi:hypothetical protein